MRITPASLPRLYEASPSTPLRILTSACLVGQKVGWDNRAYPSSLVHFLVQNPKVQAVHFCPENLILGTPRLLTTLYHGNGFDVLDGQAEVRDTDQNNLTDLFISSAHHLLHFAQKNQVDLAVMMEISDSCGSTAVYLGNPEEKKYQKGPGVSSALLIRNGIPVVGSRDEHTLGQILHLLGDSDQSFEDKIDFRNDPWFLSYFKEKPTY